MARIEAGLADFPLADVVVATSGSSGTPRLVALSATALHASARATNDVLAAGNLTGHAPLPPQQLRWVLALPTFHVAGLLVMWRALQLGSPPLVADASGGFSPDVLAEALSHAPAHGAVVPLVPTQVQKALANPRACAALSRARAVLVGGAALPATVAASAAETGLPMVTTYGMTETSGGCLYNGVPLPGVEVRVADAAGQPPVPADQAAMAGANTWDQTASVGVPTPAKVAEEGPAGPGVAVENQPGQTAPPAPGQPAAQIGRILLSGPGLALGYLGDPDGTAAAFLTADGKRWHATADSGRWDGRTLAVLGRTDWLINTGGEKVSPAQVENALLATGLVSEACVVGVPDPYWGQAVVAVVSRSAAGESAPHTSPGPAAAIAAAPNTATGPALEVAAAPETAPTSLSAPAPTPSPALQEVLEAAWPAWPAPLRPKRVVELAALPLLPNGKVDRAACAALASRA
ncbi:MAG: AMP-binding protein [Buchananella hordeovulneris]|nr:AMP-binding protein [Buchananella hordeovulneris]